MSLYRNTVTEFLGIFRTGDPGGDWTAVPEIPGAPIGATTLGWRKLDQNVATVTDWHPSLTEDQVQPPKPSGLAGSGVNIFASRYASWESQDGLPAMAMDGVEVRLVSGGFHGNWRLRITATADNGTLWFAKSSTDYNIKITPNRRWIISAYFAALSELPFTWLIQRTDAYGGSVNLIETALTTGLVGGQWERQHIDIDWLAFDSVRANMGIRLNTAGDVIDIDAIMLEELLGDDITPSAYADPAWQPSGEPDPIIEASVRGTQSGGQGLTYAALVPVGDDYAFVMEQIPAVDTATQETRGVMLWNGTLMLKKYNVNDGLNMRGIIEFIRNGEMLRSIEFTLPALRFGHLPFTFSDFEKDEGDLFYVIRIRNTGSSRFYLEEVDNWFLELKT